MPLFVIHCFDKPGHQQVRLDNRAAHLEYAKAWEDRMIVGGPLLTPATPDGGQGMVGSMLVIDLPDLAAAYDWCANDPYGKAGLFESVTVRPYRALLGSAKQA